jgi:hypothetical protein
MSRFGDFCGNRQTNRRTELITLPGWGKNHELLLATPIEYLHVMSHVYSLELIYYALKYGGHRRLEKKTKSIP